MTIYHLSDVFRFDLGLLMFRLDFWPLLQSRTRIAKLKSAYYSLIIAPKGLGCQTHTYFSEYQPPS